jgi:hypothetical protein
VATRLLALRPTAIYACIALLLFVSALQAVHACGTSSFDAPVSVEAQSGVSAGSPCLLCFLQAAEVILVLRALLCGFAVRERVSFPQFSPRVLLSSFHLHVRPPPFCNSL